MLAKDIMTQNIITATPETPVAEVAALLLRNRISAVPVVDDDSRVLGIVSEGDLMHRPENGTEKRRGAWWLNLFTMQEDLAAEYAKSHGIHAADVMTTSVVAVPEDMPLAEISQTLEENHIKRVPVVREGRLVGIVSRANLLHGLATRRDAPPQPTAASDQAIREDILHTLQHEDWATLSSANVTVENGVAHLWGMVDSDAQSKALEIVAENATGVTAVENHMGRTDPRMFFGE
jgi:CBS domain-containing protein